MCHALVFFFKPKTAYEMRISDWSSDVCSSDLLAAFQQDQLFEGIARARSGWRPIDEDLLGRQRRIDIRPQLCRLRLAIGIGGQRLINQLGTGRGSCRERVCPSV